MTNTISGPNFTEMSIQDLRAYASHMSIPLPKTATKDDIVKLIDNKIQGRTTPELALAGTVVRPGYAKIILLEDSSPDASNFPVYLNCNGYQCTIPRGREVIVPMRVVRTLNDAKVKRRKQVWQVDQNSGRESMKETVVTSPSYPFQVIEMVPGPEPLTPLEASRAKVMAPRKRYKEKFGHYPRRGELKRAIEQGFIKLDANTEALSPSEETSDIIKE
ncbi:hypothetical protein [Xanthomonas phage DES1]|nr:hypothetical protein [Xanthomonas phage DES1]